MGAISRVRAYAASHGFSYTVTRLSQIFRQRCLGSYDRLKKQAACTSAELEFQRKNPPDAGLISVVIPVYNTEPRLLRELLASLEAQTYADFEAILYDGASTRPETVRVLEEIRDPRFRVIRAGENRGISGNTNAAAENALGEYIALCDHDDLLSPDALWRAADVIARERPDLAYSDEDRIMENGRHYMDPHYKPDWSPETLLGDNYVCHLAIIRKALWQETGGLRGGFDGSQDHDLFLRLREKTDRIVHIPHILYSWREVKSSRSHVNLRSCLEASCRAVEEHGERTGRKIDAVPIGDVMRLWIGVDPDASVEALIYGDSEEDCRLCLRDLEENTSWRRFSAALIVTDEEKRFAALNEAAAGSGADYLLLVSTNVYGMNRHFIRELMMYAQDEHCAGAAPVLTDEKDRVTHAGFEPDTEAGAKCFMEGLQARAGGMYNALFKVRNVDSVSPACMLVRRENWMDFDPAYRTGLAGAELALRQKHEGRRFVVTPHATAYMSKDPLLLSGTARNEADLERFAHAADRRVKGEE